MEFSKEAIRQIKNDIKGLVSEQKVLKPQRKTINFNGTRTVTPSEAVDNHLYNRYQLRHLYVAYGMMRGKTLDQIEPSRKTQPHEKTITTILDKYGKAVCADQG